MLSSFVFVLVCCVAIISYAAAFFLAKEMMKKFAILKKFSNQTKLIRNFNHDGTKKGCMRNIVLRSEDGSDFSALIGFEIQALGLTGFDHFGQVQSCNGQAVIRTYLGKKPCVFQFLLSHDLKIIVSSNDTNQNLLPEVTFPPHPWQRFGFYS